MVEQIRRYLNAAPFEPFVLNLADGRVLRVESPEALWLTPKGGIIFWHAEDDTVERLNPLLISGVRGTMHA